MNVLIVLVPVSLILSAVALLTFLWTLRSAQYDDLDGDAWRILTEDEAMPSEEPSETQARS